LTLSIAIAVLVRLLLVILFLPASALDKILDFRGAVAQAGEMFRPRPVAAGVILMGLAIEILMPLAILTGVADRLAAVVLAAYCVATAVLFKRFWRLGDFWASGHSKARDVFWDFLKNLSLAGGFLLITVGTDGRQLGPFLTDPLGSSHPYVAAGAMHVR
jgi:putative oxidoreductase